MDKFSAAMAGVDMLGDVNAVEYVTLDTLYTVDVMLADIEEDEEDLAEYDYEDVVNSDMEDDEEDIDEDSEVEVEED